MGSHTLLVYFLVLEAVILVASLVIFLGHGSWVLLRERMTDGKLKAARAALVRSLEPDGPSPVRELRALPSAMQIELIANLAFNLSGEYRSALVRTATETGIVQRAEGLCTDRSWRQRLEGARLLTLLDIASDVMPPLLDDRRPEVQAQAAEWAAGHPSDEVIARLIRMIEEPATLCRFAVQDSLIRMSKDIVDPLSERLGGSSTNARQSIKAIRGLAEPRLLQPVMRLATDEAPAVRARAARVLGGLGGRHAVDQLRSMLDDEADEVRAAAATALGRLGFWPAATQLAMRLRDRAWVVRRESALALHALGGPGILLLRRALTDEDRFAADIARQVLDVAGTAEAVALP